MNTQELPKIIQEKALFFSSEKETILNSDGSRARYTIDLRGILLEPDVLSFVADQFWKKYSGFKRLQVAGLELASVTMITAIILAGKEHGCSARGLIIRKSRKKYGLQKSIEGDYDHHTPTILVDDLVNSGSSVLKAWTQLNEVGIQVQDVFSVLDYGSPKKQAAFDQRGLQHFFLTRLDQVVEVPAKESIDISSYRTVFSYDPQTLYNGYQVFCRSNPALDEQHVYYGTDSAELIALNKATGELVWKYAAVRIEALKGIWSSPLVIEDGICFGCYDGNFYYLDRHTGQPKWILSHANFIGSSPDFSPEHQLIFVGFEYALPGKHGSIAAVDVDTGAIRWEHATHGYVHSSPLYVAKSKMVICGSNDKDLLALDAGTGRLLWRAELPGICKMKPALSALQDVIFVSCTDAAVRAVEVSTGRILWTYQTQFGNLATPLCIQNKIVVGSLDNCIHILDEDSGRLLKKIQTDARIMSQPQFHAGRVYLGNNAGAVFEIDLDLLQIVGRYQLPDRVVAGVAYDSLSGQFYAHTSDDRLFSWKKISAQTPDRK